MKGKYSSHVAGLQIVPSCLELLSSNNRAFEGIKGQKGTRITLKERLREFIGVQGGVCSSGFFGC